MKYYSETLDKMFDTVKELKIEEEKVAKEKAEKEAAEAKLKEERAARAKAVETALTEAKDAQKKANELLKDFINDYHSFHMTIKNDTSDSKNIIEELLSWRTSRF